MGAGISLPNRPLGPPVERGSCLAAPLWSPVRACCHVSPCPHGCVPHSYLHSPFALASAFPFVLPFALLCPCPSLLLPFLLPCALLCLCPAVAFALLCSCPVLFCLGLSLPSLFLPVLVLPASGCILIPSSSGHPAQDEELVYMQCLSCQSCCAALFLVMRCYQHAVIAACASPQIVSSEGRDFGCACMGITVLEHVCHKPQCSTCSRAFDVHIYTRHQEPVSSAVHRTAKTIEPGWELLSM